MRAISKDFTTVGSCTESVRKDRRQDLLRHMGHLREKRSTKEAVGRSEDTKKGWVVENTLYFIRPQVKWALCGSALLGQRLQRVHGLSRLYGNTQRLPTTVIPLWVVPFTYCRAHTSSAVTRRSTNCCHFKSLACSSLNLRGNSAEGV